MRPVDTDLPVWTLAPDWSQGITERLEWLTDVRASTESACEQRAALRLNPRRSLEAPFVLAGAERTFVDLWANRIGKGECMVPLWHDRGALTTAAAAAATTLAVDTVDREFLDGGMALLVGSTPFTCEAVRIDTVSDAAISLVAAATRAWPAGTVIHPLRRGRLDSEGLSNATSRVSTVTLRFMLDGVDDAVDGDDLPTYLGLPVLTTPPNWSSAIDTNLKWLTATRDSDTGRVFMFDPAARALPGQQHRWLFDGRAEQRAFRRLLYRLAGRARSLWLPTFADDLTVSRGAASGDTHLDIDIVGLGYVGGPAPGREHIVLPGALATRLSAMDTAPSVTEERVTLASALSRAVTAGEIASFIDTSRLDQDAVEITHHSDSDGAAECTLVFRAFDASRDGSAAGALDIPTTAMNPTACGAAPRSKHEIFDDHWVGLYARDAAMTYALTAMSPGGSPAGNTGVTKVFDMHAETAVADFINTRTWTFEGISVADPVGNKINFCAIDSTGTVWGHDQPNYLESANSLLISVADFGTGVVTVHGQWTPDGYPDTDGDDHSTRFGRTQCFDLPDDSQMVVSILAEQAWHADNGVISYSPGGSITKYDALSGTGTSWHAANTMQDEHGDIWLIGTPFTTGDVSSIYLWRIVASGSSPITTSFAHVTGMPTITGDSVHTTNSDVTGGVASGGKFYIMTSAGGVTRIDPTTMTVLATYTDSDLTPFQYLNPPAGSTTLALTSRAHSDHWSILTLADFSVAGPYDLVDWSPSLSDYTGPVDYDPSKDAIIGIAYSAGAEGVSNASMIGWYSQ